MNIWELLTIIAIFVIVGLLVLIYLMRVRYITKINDIDSSLDLSIGVSVELARTLLHRGEHHEALKKIWASEHPDEAPPVLCSGDDPSDEAIQELLMAATQNAQLMLLLDNAPDEVREMVGLVPSKTDG